MPSSLVLSKAAVSDAFDLFDAEGAGSLDLEDFALAIASLGIEMTPSETEEVFKKAKGSTDNALPLSKDEFLVIVRSWDQKQTFHQEVGRMFKAFTKGSSKVGGEQLNSVQEHLGWDVNDERNEKFVEEASKTYHDSNVTAGVWMKVMCEVANKPHPDDDVEEY